MCQTVPSTQAIMEKRHFARCWLRCLVFLVVGLGTIWVLGELVSVLALLSSSRSTAWGGGPLGLSLVQTFDEVWLLIGVALGKSMTLVVPGIIVWVLQVRLARLLVPMPTVECPECGYAVRELREARCPECGLSLPSCLVGDDAMK